MHSGEPVCADPFAWLASGLTTNTGMFHLGQPGTGKSAFAKRQIVGMVAHGVRPVVLGDVKGEYAQLVGRLGGQVIRVGRGLDRLNPLDTRMLSDPAGADARGRQLNLLMALCASVRRDRPLSNGEQVILAAAVDEVVARSPQAVVPQVLAALQEPTPELFAAAQVRTLGDYDAMSQQLRWTLGLLVRRDPEGGLRRPQYEVFRSAGARDRGRPVERRRRPAARSGDAVHVGLGPDGRAGSGCRLGQQVADGHGRVVAGAHRSGGSGGSCGCADPSQPCRGAWPV
jgi:hypothetical protein